MSARESSDAPPLSTVNREPVIFAARSKSRMPRAGPRSQCASGGKSKRVGSPHVFTTTFADSSAPSGTEECGTFGSVSSMGDEARIQRLQDFLRMKRMAAANSLDHCCSPLRSRRRRSAPTFSEIAFFSARAASICVIFIAPFDVDFPPLRQRAGWEVATPVQLGELLKFSSQKISGDHGATHSSRGAGAGCPRRTRVLFERSEFTREGAGHPAQARRPTIICA